MTISEIRERTERAPDDADERVLRAKYLDWCSAQVADQFLALSPDEIFELAERAAGGTGVPAGRSFYPEAEQDLSAYRQLVKQVTDVLASQMELPSYVEWLELYRAAPESVEAQLLGLWRERVDEAEGT